MKNTHWNYQIGGNFQGLIPALIMLAIFGGVTLWLHGSQNSAVVFGGVLTAIALTAVAGVFYCAFFVKVLVGEKGVYHQTNPFNGRFYTYAEIVKAWESAGRLQNGVQGNYCAFQTGSGKVIRFWYYPYESDGVKYFLERIACTDHTNDDHHREGQWDYKIDGRHNAKAGILIFSLLWALFTVLAVDQLRDMPNKSIYLAFAFGGVSIPLLCIVIWLIIRYVCFKVLIGENGFYFQSAPLNGRFYQYSDIKNCREVLKTYHHHGTDPSRSYHYYFFFTEKGGKSRKFVFEKLIYEREIDLLKERIKRVQDELS